MLEGKTNLRYILIVAVLAVIFGGGILFYQYWWVPKEKLKESEVKTLEEKLIIEKSVLNLTSTKLTTIPKEYKYVCKSSLTTFSPDGRRVAYKVSTFRERKENEAIMFPEYPDVMIEEFMVVDGQKGKTYYMIFPAVFSPDGKQVAYSAFTMENKKALVVLNGQEGKSYDAIGDHIIFSPDSKQFAYAAQIGGKWFAVVNGKESEAYDMVEDLIFSPDGKKIAYHAWKKDKGEFIVVNGKEGKAYKFANDPVFSPDSEKIAYVAGGGFREKKFVVINEVENDRKYDLIYTLLFSPDSKQLAYVVGMFTTMGEKRWVIVNGNEGKPYDWIGNITFNPDGTKIAYEAGIKEDDVFDLRYFVIVNNKENRPSEEIKSNSYDYFGCCGPIFSSDGKKMAYEVRGTKKGESSLVVNGEEGKGYWDIMSFVFSPDSKNIAYNTERFIVVNSQEGKSYDCVWSPIFSSDSKYVAYGAKIGQELWWIVDKVE